MKRSLRSRHNSILGEETHHEEHEGDVVDRTDRLDPGSPVGMARAKSGMTAGDISELPKRGGGRRMA